jgi:hypothetical protein
VVFVADVVDPSKSTFVCAPHAVTAGLVSNCTISVFDQHMNPAQEFNAANLVTSWTHSRGAAGAIGVTVSSPQPRDGAGALAQHAFAVNVRSNIAGEVNLQLNHSGYLMSDAVRSIAGAVEKTLTTLACDSTAIEAGSALHCTVSTYDRFTNEAVLGTSYSMATQHSTLLAATIVEEERANSTASWPHKATILTNVSGLLKVYLSDGAPHAGPVQVQVAPRPAKASATTVVCATTTALTDQVTSCRIETFDEYGNRAKDATVASFAAAGFHSTSAATVVTAVQPDLSSNSSAFTFAVSSHRAGTVRVAVWHSGVETDTMVQILARVVDRTQTVLECAPSDVITAGLPVACNVSLFDAMGVRATGVDPSYRHSSRSTHPRAPRSQHRARLPWMPPWVIASAST